MDEIMPDDAESPQEMTERDIPDSQSELLAEFERRRRVNFNFFLLEFSINANITPIYSF